MQIKKIKLKNIRNYENEEIKFNKNINILLGENGQGKTNLIESIYICSFSKSFRTNIEKDIINFNKEKGIIEIYYNDEDEENKIEYKLDNKGKKEIKINEVKINKLSELVGNLLVVIFYPDDLKIIKEDPEKRRSFIDREICQISLSYYNDLSIYKKILAQRNKYLKEENLNKEMLDVWDYNLCKYGNNIIKKRKDFIIKLNEISSKIYNSIKENEKIIIEYDGSIKEDEDFYEITKKNLIKDIENRTTTKGPHKDDIKIFINDREIKKFGSQGQQRTMALVLKLAEIEIIKEEKGKKPIVLLDDFLSELDEERQKLVIKYLKNIQTFITTTNISDKISKELGNNKNIYYIKNGKLLRKES